MQVPARRAAKRDEAKITAWREESGAHNGRVSLAALIAVKPADG